MRPTLVSLDPAAPLPVLDQSRASLCLPAPAELVWAMGADPALVGLSYRQGGHLSHTFESYEAAVDALARIEQRRRWRHYERVE